MKIKIQFFTYWHCGAGSSGGSNMDALVIKDKNGLPYVPGKTLKGHIREMAETLKESSTFVDSCFGKASKENDKNENRNEAECYFSNAVLEEAIDPEVSTYLFQSIASTKIDSKNALAVEGSLREVEVTVPLTLYASIENCNNKAMMIQAFGQVKRMGLNRSRGLGRCEISLAEGVNHD